ncbi:TnsD family Tn7-like transposition protein [Pseudoalteromonas rhizosphaerae]|uniref:TnsD family Tn7-like transposition protein n=1 Tax=Pseudoalteromonas rhizosphaerae TaxID=2518973 RepID=A0ABW8L5A0_9GAMM
MQLQLPTSLPDETLFSRYVRHMTMLGMNGEDYLKALLKKPRASIHPYLTIGITKAAQISSNTVSTIYREQTLGRLFSYFLPQQSQAIFKTLLSNNGNTAIRACQLVTFKESEKLSLKYCPHCAREDIKKHGVAYWHRMHQVPGIEACHLHGFWLVHEELPERPHVKFLLLPTHAQESELCSDLSYEFAKFAESLLNKISRTNKKFDQNTIIEHLKKHNFMAGDKRFKRKELTTNLFHFGQKLEKISPCLLPYSETDYRYWSYLLSGEVSQHPFKYLLVLFWMEYTSNNASEVNPIKYDNKSDTNREDCSALCIRLLKQRESLAEVSRITGKSRCYIKALAMKNNIPVELKPKVITESLICAVLKMAYKGFHRKVMATQFQISTGSVEQIISSEEGLVEKRKQFRYQSKRRKYKATILRAIRDNPSAIKQEIKKHCYAAFHWLYANERIWLNATLPPPTKPIVRSKVDWDKRDFELALEVKAIMCMTKGTITRTKLDKALGGHGWLTRYANRLPETIKYIEEHLNV